MFINEAGRTTGLTRKAIEYYIQQGLISPEILENGYRDFSESDVEDLRKISVLRKLGVGTGDIGAVLTGGTGSLLRKIAVQKELAVSRERERKELLDKLSQGISYAEIEVQLKAIEDGATVTERLLDAFPGYYGNFICLHFARFLNEPAVSQRQRKAFGRIITFLDDLPTLDIPQNLWDYLEESTGHLGAGQMTDIIESTKKSIENPDEFLSQNKDTIEMYLEFKRSEEYRSSPGYQLQKLLREFNSASGYYDIFIPALKDLSPAYAEYCELLEAANEKFVAEYPESSELVE